MSNSYKATYISKKLYQELSDLASKKTGGYTGQGIVADLIEEIIQNYLDSQKVSSPKQSSEDQLEFVE